MRLVMMGTGTFAEPTFEAILKHFPSEVVGLVTQPDRDAGRRSGSSRQTGIGMANIAKAHSIPVLQPASINSDEGIALLATLNPDLCVVAAYGQIFKAPVLAVPKLGFINVHASLLPKYRGAAPVAHAILNGETETGVTIFRITTGIDSGDMLDQESLTIGEEETTGELESRLAIVGAIRCVNVIERMQRGPIQGTKQDANQMTKAPKITKEMGLIDWTKRGVEVRRHIRAMQPWPTAYTYLHRPGKEPMRIIILELYNWLEEPAEAETITIACCNEVLDVRTLQPAGKKPMSAAEFVRGYPHSKDDRFGPERLP